VAFKACSVEKVEKGCCGGGMNKTTNLLSSLPPHLNYFT
jgi:hypothetical protein